MNTVVNVIPLLTEELFQHIWKFRLFTQSGLTTLDGQPLQILHPGIHNNHAGPDFTAARIRIDQTLWAGNIELHLKTSDWYRHRHQHNQQYENVILHVVFNNDVKELTTGGIPCIELQQFVPKMLFERFIRLRESADLVPCGKMAARVPYIIWEKWKERLLAERLERKANRLQSWLLCNRYNWEEVCYWAVAESFGLPVNGEAFLQLAQSLPYNLLMRHQQSIFHLEALLFGQAGMLEGNFKDEYPLRLQQEYNYMRHKYQLQPLSGYLWKWLRMRPSSFPTIRIACLAALLQKGSHLFSKILETNDLARFEQLISVQPSLYWQQHYRFDVPARNVRNPGLKAAQSVLINSVLPLLYLYGQEKMKYCYQEKAIDFMNLLPAEENRVIREWGELGVKAKSAQDSQALLQLKNNYCQEKKCLQCAIGAKLLKEEISD
ncbi:Protein of unknown function [Chitinophaga sp. CF118]|uniref:DUF2851 family protein n=1 Tax=Chitinophaga sp. CF118 TaxID=1884367 RepID=UPI0008DF764A|nr:DUF2851 family protein [Chitinophaga sp. CF118]SFE12243.1 Protein of unknown function [Chitinophaga sp. CF118]